MAAPTLCASIAARLTWSGCEAWGTSVPQATAAGRPASERPCMPFHELLDAACVWKEHAPHSPQIADTYARRDPRRIWFFCISYFVVS